MARGKPHSDELKAAVLAALIAGEGVEEVAEHFNLPLATVGTWKKEINPKQFETLRNKKQKNFGDLLSSYLSETLETLSIQARHFRDKDWLERQSAAELGVLHGIQTDKAIRLLEALERANGGTETTPADE